MKKIKLEKRDLDLYYHEYKNGFKIFLIPDTSVNFYYMTLNSRFGSIYTKFKREDEKEYITIPNGVAHFLEHLTFKTEDGDATDYFSSLSANSNAYTTYDLTSYEVSGVTDFNKCLDYLLTYVSTPYYTEELVNNEKPIICEEIKSHTDRAVDRAMNKFRNNIFDKLNYKYDICGTQDDVNNTTVEDIKNAYDYFYTPNNLFLVITGNFDKDECKSIVDNHEISKKECNLSKIEIYKEDEKEEVVNVKEIIKDDVPNTYLYMASKIKMDKLKTVSDENIKINGLVNIVLEANFGITSDLVEYLTDNELIDSDSISNSSSTYDDLKVCYYSVSTSKPEEVAKEIKKKINNLDIDQETFDRIKRVFLSQIIKSSENPYKVNSHITRRIIDYDKIYENNYSDIEKLTLDEAKEICKLLNTSNVCEVVLMPES